MSLDTQSNEAQAVMNQIEQRHRDLARDLGVTPSHDLEEQFKRLRQIAAGIALVGEVSERLRARVMAQGELMATRLGAAFLSAQGSGCAVGGRSHRAQGGAAA